MKLTPHLVGFSVANALTVIGTGAAALGVALVIAGIAVVWLAWSGAALALVALAARTLLVRNLRPVLDRIAEEGRTTIYMPLLSEGTDEWRPVEAMKIGELGYIVTEYPPSEERWAFEAGHILRCEERDLHDGKGFVAVARAT